ncbi:MAG: hypothetical protein V3V08_00410 [Nannocystaceae bacterium]
MRKSHKPQARATVLGSFLIFVLGACSNQAEGNASSEGDDDPQSGDTGAEAVYAPCPSEARLGSVRVEVADGFTAIVGLIMDSVMPSNVEVVVAESGSCRLLTKNNYFCDPPCITNEVCGTDGSCVPAPQSLTFGDVAINGMHVAGTLELNNGWYQYPGTLPHPAFAEGDLLQLVATGGHYEPFRLDGRGLDRVAVTSTQVVLSRGDPIPLRWTAGDGTATMRIHLDINLHGSTWNWIECVAPDSGTFEIPADIAAQLMDAGVSGYPTLLLTRRSVDSTIIGPGCVEFEVKGEFSLPVTIPGLTSCSTDDDCPEGQTCQPDLTCG